MADGYSRSGAGLGVVAATSGGGCLNTVAGLGEALASRVPVLALIGQAPTTLDGRGAFQDTSGRNGALNGEALFSAVSVFCRRVMSPDDIVTALPEAIAAAQRGGPAVLLLPKNIQQADLDFAASVNGTFAGLSVGNQLGDPQAIARALRHADGAITIIAGEQVARDDARAELAQLTCEAARSGGHRPRCQGRRGHTGPRIVLGARGDRRDGTSGGRHRDRRQRVVPTGRHPTDGDRACRTGRRAGVGAYLLDRIGGAVRAIHPRPYRGPARIPDTADAGVERQRPSDPPSGPGPGAEDRVATAAARRPGGALPRGDGRAGCRAA